MTQSLVTFGNETASDATAAPTLFQRAGALLSTPWVTVLLLTGLGALLRFMYLTRPPLWGDEVLTFRRVCSDFPWLVDQLSTMGLFTPLHYLLYWWIGQQTTLTPFMMRLPVAIAGTLMVPAMYFLAVQLVSKKTALLVTLFTACSAYMLNYSRDAKMYMETWLCVTLNVACLLWWLRTRLRVAWWAWLCSGVIMVGLQAVALAILPIELIIVVTARQGQWRSLVTLLYALVEGPVAFVMDFLSTGGYDGLGTPGSCRRWFQRTFVGFRWPPILFFLIGTAIIAVGPCVYYMYFSERAERVYSSADNSVNWTATGIYWVGPYNEGRTWTDLLRYTGTAFLYSWEWPRPVEESGVNVRTLKLLKGAAIGLAVLLALGMFPWRSVRDEQAERKRGFEPILKESPGNESVGNFGVAPPNDKLPRPPLRVLPAMWLVTWIILPAYLFYRISEDRALWPIDWLASTFVVNPPRLVVPHAPADATWYAQLWWPITHFSVAAWLSEWRAAVTVANIRWWVVGAMVVALMGWGVLLCLDFRRQIRAAWTLLSMLLVMLILCTLARVYVPSFPDSVWMPRYLGFVWPAFAIAVCALLMRLPTRPLRWGAIGLLMVVNLSQHWGRVFAGSEPPVDQMARDVAVSQSSDSRCYVDMPFKGPKPGEGALFTYCGRYYLHISSGKPIEPDELLTRGYESKFDIWTPRILPPFEMFVANTVQDAPSLKRIIVWDSLRPGEIRSSDEIIQKLSPTWKLVSLNEYKVRDHWTWRDLITARRRVYERKPFTGAAPATQDVQP
jgi:hypothetical protein